MRTTCSLSFEALDLKMRRNQFVNEIPLTVIRSYTYISVDGLPPFEISTLHHFLAAARTGNFPGKKTELPLWPEMEMQYFSKKYSEWAPKPYCDLPQPAAGPFGPVGGQSPPPAIRVTLALSSFDYMFNQLFTFAGQNLSPEEVARRLASADRGTSFNITKSKVGFQPRTEAPGANHLDLVWSSSSI